MHLSSPSEMYAALRRDTVYVPKVVAALPYLAPCDMEDCAETDASWTSVLTAFVHSELPTAYVPHVTTTEVCCPRCDRTGQVAA